MKYVMLLMGHVDDPRCEDGGPTMEDYFAYDKEITAAGVVENSFALEDPETAVAVSFDEKNEPITTTGPFAEVKEFVGGAYVIEVATIDEALQWARKCPAARDGRVEVRPLAPY